MALVQTKNDFNLSDTLQMMFKDIAVFLRYDEMKAYRLQHQREGGMLQNTVLGGRISSCCWCAKIAGCGSSRVKNHACKRSLPVDLVGGDDRNSYCTTYRRCIWGGPLRFEKKWSCNILPRDYIVYITGSYVRILTCIEGNWLLHCTSSI